MNISLADVLSYNPILLDSVQSQKNVIIFCKKKFYLSVLWFLHT